MAVNCRSSVRNLQLTAINKDMELKLFFQYFYNVSYCIYINSRLTAIIAIPNITPLIPQ